MKICGLDLSLTATGWASATVASGRTTVEYGLVRPGDLRGPERLAEISVTLRGIVEGATLVIIEGYAFGSGGTGKAGDGAFARAHSLGEVGGVVKTMLWHQRHRVAIAPPTTLKRYATGKGNARKDLVYGEAIRRLGYSGSDHNEADALWLAAMGLDRLGVPLVKMPVPNRTGLAGVDWPDLDQLDVDALIT